jgi:hypothetical protein
MMMQSCVNKESSNDDLFKSVSIVIDFDSIKSIPLTLNRIRYIPLETTNECLIARANKTMIRNNKIYVADFSKAMALFVFDMNGKFLFKISQRGQGPGEYLSFRDFDIQTNGDIYMFDNHGSKILIYNQTGEYLREIKSEHYFSKFCLVNSKMYWSKLIEAGHMYANLAVYDTVDKSVEFVFQDKKFLHDMGILNYSDYDFCYSPNYTTYYSPKFSEIIYSIDEDGVHPAIGIKNLNKPTQYIIDEWLRAEGFDRVRMISSSKYFIETVDIYETDKYIAFACFNSPLKENI